ncbi:hypothetical protein L226DRAFT_39795 [Lentinus tigrinus ALCF2SS1-7]|uniref:uncharacterized protein n=1 Tax=Lentinus tigrinus ALCF2SS1-7 TaxID=1328758 RepID=UPI001165C937|nr:hypothetical protein L226DRAFT_39795 [Lentinus tigrinus ALCF2SS1-7]
MGASPACGSGGGHTMTHCPEGVLWPSNEDVSRVHPAVAAFHIQPSAPPPLAFFGPRLPCRFHLPILAAILSLFSLIIPYMHYCLIPAFFLRITINYRFRRGLKLTRSLLPDYADELLVGHA